VSETSRQRRNRDQVLEMGSLDSLSRIFLPRKRRVRRRLFPVSGHRKANHHAENNVIEFKESRNARFNFDRRSVAGVRGILP
jgi:hypothetical protein